MAETLEFRSELRQILEIITHSLYSNREIFLRELISNASDAIDKRRFEGLTNTALALAGEPRIKLVPDKEKGTLTVSDNGIGLSREEAIENLGTIAHSGTKAFLARLKETDAKDRPELIGQFGVGFYSVFMVADRVTVVSRPAGGTGTSGVRWESEGQGTYTVEDIEKESAGTDVVLHLKADDKTFLESWKLRQIVKQFSDFIEYPVVIDTEKEGKVEEETLNSKKALWLKSKSEVTPEEYNAFYRQLSHDTVDPARVLHYTGEGTVEFRALLYVPSRKPMDFEWGDTKWGPRLYVKRVLIIDKCEALLPAYLRFVVGVVDSSDLPLNVSRELLQDNPVVPRIQKSLTKNILKGLADLKTSDAAAYRTFFDALGNVLKEGLGRDFANREAIADLMLFSSLKTEAGSYTTLAEYVEKMPADQTEIFYLTGESREQLAAAPYLEVYREKGWDVLLLTDPIDDLVMPALHEYKGKSLKAADRVDPAEKDAEKDALAEGFGPLFEALKTKLPEVAAVRLSKRLKESASCLVTDEHGPSANLERLLKRSGRADDLGAASRTLELNGEHPAVQALKKLQGERPEDPLVETYARLLYEEAVVAEGSRIPDPAAFAKRINDLIVRTAGAI